MKGEKKKSYCFASVLARINQGGDGNVMGHYSATKVRFVLVTRRGKLDSPSMPLVLRGETETLAVKVFIKQTQYSGTLRTEGIT
jgi:hypothetical protein